MARQNLKWQLPVLILFIIGTVFILRKHNNQPFQKSTGTIFGTIFHSTYQYSEDLTNEIIAELKKVDNSLSQYNTNSTISRINRNEDIEPDSFFIATFLKAEEVSKKTDGAFDITIAPLTNAWGFGFQKRMDVDSFTIDSLRQIVGYQKVNYSNDRIIKQDPRIMLNASAIAKGFGSDVVARLFDSKGIKNYMVEIGGEIMVKGMNPQKNRWHIGINKPVDDSLSLSSDIKATLAITDLGMATSGNYRNYYYKNGKKYAHSIDPRSGYPVEHSLLSATVIAKDCMTADAYSTAFMIMGFEKAKEFAEKENMDVYFIFSDEEDRMQTYFSDGMKQYLVEEKQ